MEVPLQWRHNGRNGVSNHQPHHCLLNHLLRHRSKKTSNLHFTGLCVGNSPVTSKFTTQMASYAENVSIWWRHHGCALTYCFLLDIDLSTLTKYSTHWGRVMHICVSKLTIICSDNGLSPGRRQAIIWTNAGILLNGPLGTNFNEIVIAIQTFSVKKMHLKMSSGKWRPLCLGLIVLTIKCVSVTECVSKWAFMFHGYASNKTTINILIYFIFNFYPWKFKTSNKFSIFHKQQLKECPYLLATIISSFNAQRIWRKCHKFKKMFF